MIARLEKTREDIAEVEGKTVTSIGEVYENIHSTEEKHSLSISNLSDSLVVLKDCKIANIALFQLKVIFLTIKTHECQVSIFRCYSKFLTVSY